MSAAPKVAAQLIITIHDDGSVNVNGPLANKILCYGLLDVAKDIILEQSKKTGPQLVVAPAGSVPTH